MPTSPDSVFLNVPYDARYEKLYLAFISGLCAYGLTPRATLEIPGGERRLDRIFRLMTSCRYSIHDLSRVQLDTRPPRTPRFNMPFELGLLLGWLKTDRKVRHTWFVFEAEERRLQKSLSDLDGTDPYIHGGRVRGVFRQLSNALVKSKHQPSLPQMYRVYSHCWRAVPLVMKYRGATSMFEASVFRGLVVVASEYARLELSSQRR